jgi:hypothetical protein
MGYNIVDKTHMFCYSVGIMTERSHPSSNNPNATSGNHGRSHGFHSHSGRGVRGVPHIKGIPQHIADGTRASGETTRPQPTSELGGTLKISPADRYVVVIPEKKEKPQLTRRERLARTAKGAGVAILLGAVTYNVVAGELAVNDATPTPQLPNATTEEGKAAISAGLADGTLIRVMTDEKRPIVAKVAAAITPDNGDIGPTMDAILNDELHRDEREVPLYTNIIVDRSGLSVKLHNEQFPDEPVPPLQPGIHQNTTTNG